MKIDPYALTQIRCIAGITAEVAIDSKQQVCLLIRGDGQPFYIPFKPDEAEQLGGHLLMGAKQAIQVSKLVKA